MNRLEHKRNINKKSEDEIIEEIKIALKDIRFNKGRTYIALSNMKSTFVLQPLRPERERKNIYNYQDSRGKYIMHEVIDIANNPKGEGFIEYYFNKLTDTKKEHKKISYIKLFKELGLIIIVGDYLDAFKIDIQQKVLNYIQKFRYKNDAYLFMLDSKGNVLYYPSKEAINHNIFKEKEFSYMSNYYKDLILKKGMMQKLLYPLIQK